MDFRLPILILLCVTFSTHPRGQAATGDDRSRCPPGALEAEVTELRTASARGPQDFHPFASFVALDSHSVGNRAQWGPTLLRDLNAVTPGSFADPMTQEAIAQLFAQDPERYWNEIVRPSYDKGAFDTPGGTKRPIQEVRRDFELAYIHALQLAMAQGISVGEPIFEMILKSSPGVLHRFASDWLQGAPVAFLELKSKPIATKGFLLRGTEFIKPDLRERLFLADMREFYGHLPEMQTLILEREKSLPLDAARRTYTGAEILRITAHHQEGLPITRIESGRLRYGLQLFASGQAEKWRTPASSTEGLHAISALEQLASLHGIESRFAPDVPEPRRAALQKEIQAVFTTLCKRALAYERRLPPAFCAKYL